MQLSRAKTKRIKLILLIIFFVMVLNTPMILATGIKYIKYEDSPFGFLGPVSGGPKTFWEDYTQYVKDLGVHWVRNGGFQGLRWGDVQPNEGGPYNWEKYDKMVRALQDSNINLMICILPVSNVGVLQEGRRFPPGRFSQGGMGTPPFARERLRIMLPKNLDAYKRFVEAVVERYDGDGFNDMEGLRYPIKYWMTSHEPNHPFFWGDTPENYAILVKETCEAIKKADPSAKIILAGTAGQIGDYLYKNEKIPEGYDTVFPERKKKEDEEGFFIRFYRKLNEIAPQTKKSVDIMDFHIFDNFGDYSKIEKYIFYINRVSRDFGFGEKPIWITETSTFAGSIKDRGINFQAGKRLYQSEKEQAQELFKRYIFSLAKGVKKIFWDGPVYSDDDSFFGKAGLISYNGKSRLGYYTYKKMVEKLEGSDWNNIETMETGLNNVYVFRFPKKDAGFPVYVAWWDYDKEKGSAVSNKKWIYTVKAKQVKITGAIPSEDSGEKVRDYKTAFKTEMLPVNNSKVTIYLNRDPCFLEIIN